MVPLYPHIKPHARHHLKVDDLHEVYVDESGSIEGIPVVSVHGGPGSGCEFNSRRFFNPEKYRIVLFDQRGAGRSLPYTSLINNTLPNLVEDMEKIRIFLGIEKWLISGGGWGATLGLAYAESFPDRVLGMILRGVFLGRQRDIDWIYADGTSRYYPDHWEDFIAPTLNWEFTPRKKRAHYDIYHDLMMQENELARMSAAKTWSKWEAYASTVHPSSRLVRHFSDGRRAYARCLISTYYFRNACFLDPNQLLENARVLSEIPGILVHGRFDCISPMDSSHELRRAWPNAQLYVVREAGHSATEPAMIDALIRATDDMSMRFGPDFGV